MRRPVLCRVCGADNTTQNASAVETIARARYLLAGDGGAILSGYDAAREADRLLALVEAELGGAELRVELGASAELAAVSRATAATYRQLGAAGRARFWANLRTMIEAATEVDAAGGKGGTNGPPF